MVFSVFTAASTLLYHSKHSKDATSENHGRLKLCIHWLSVLGKSWKSAGTRHQMLADSELPSDSIISLLTSGTSVFDLPQDLQSMSNNSKLLHSPSPEAGANQTYSSAIPAPATNGYKSVLNEQSPEDWGFLRDFGDAGDEFFELDVQLRGLLDGGFGLDNMMFDR